MPTLSLQTSPETSRWTRGLVAAICSSTASLGVSAFLAGILHAAGDSAGLATFLPLTITLLGAILLESLALLLIVAIRLENEPQPAPN